MKTTTDTYYANLYNHNLNLGEIVKVHFGYRFDRLGTDYVLGVVSDISKSGATATVSTIRGEIQFRYKYTRRDSRLDYNHSGGEWKKYGGESRGTSVFLRTVNNADVHFGLN